MFKDLLKIKQDFLNFFLTALAFSIPLSQWISSKLLLIAVLFSIASFTVNKGKQWFTQSWDLLFIIIVSAFGLLYTESFSSGISVLETRLSLLAMPFVFSGVAFQDLTKLRKLNTAFVLGLVTACLICLGHAVMLYNNGGNDSVFLFYNLTTILGFQPTYFAYYIVFAITLLVYELYNGKKRDAGLLVVGMLFLFMMLMLTGGRTAFISVLFIFSFLIFRYLTDEGKTERKAIAVGIITMQLAAMFIINLIDKDENKFTDAWDRVVVWESAIKASPDMLLGVGTGGAMAVLDEYYMAHGLEKFANKGYNSHNQFIQLLFSNGVLGLLAAVLLLARPLYVSFKANNVLGILMIFPFLIYGMTEVFLGRYQGVILFAFLHQLVIISSGLKNVNLNKQKGIIPQVA